MTDRQPIAILGASGLIGQAVTEDLAKRGFSIAAVARRFTPAERGAINPNAIQQSFVDFDQVALTRFIDGLNADVIVNCIGVLQDGPGGRAADAHGGFVNRLVVAIATTKRPTLLIHLSIPGNPEDDKTPFSRTKREAEYIIAKSGLHFVILRPGFVIAPAAYGGSALIRALAALPFDLPTVEKDRPFAATAVADIAATIAHVTKGWRAGDTIWSAIWDVMEREPSTVGGVIEAFRRRFGGPAPQIPLPGWLLTLGATCADLAGRLGWAPPIRSTALAEMRRGVTGNPETWIHATGIEPTSLQEALNALPATIQERWFARLYLAKSLVIGALAIFWFVSGLIALTFGFGAAISVFTDHGFNAGIAYALVIITSLLDITIGCAIAIRRFSRLGLLAGCTVAFSYLLSATILTPALWADPLGSLVKVAPAIMLMLVALAVLEDR